MEDNGPWLDKFHALHPNISLGVSEYSCEGIITYHGPEPKCKDYSEDYQALYHEHMAKVLDERPWIWSSHVWNMFDFGCAARDEGGVAGRNNKGLVTLDDGPMEFPEGKMSIRTKIMDIYKNEEAWEFVSKMMGGFKLSPEHPMWNMIGNFNMETLMGMNGAPDEKMLKLLNKKLGAYDLVD